jgi:hypothetical protein
METTKKQIEEAINNLRGGFYGTAEIVDFENENYYLVRTEIADPAEDWECAEYHLLKKDLSESHYLAHCDGYNGYDLKMTSSEIEKLIGEEEIEEYIKPYNLTGDLLAAAKLNTLTEADEDYEGKCKVWVEYCYSSSTLNHPNDGFACDDNRDEIIFENYDAAQEWIDEMNSGPYYLSHGEMGSPDYIIIEAD